MNLAGYGIEVGHPAELVVLDCQSEVMAVAEIAQPLMSFENGRKSFVGP